MNEHHSKEDARRTHHFRRVRAQRKTAERAARDAESVLEYLRDLERASSVEEIRRGLSERRPISAWALRGLLRHLVARRSVIELRGAIPGRRTVLFQARVRP